MSAALTLGGPDHLEKLLPLVASFHAEEGITSSEEDRHAGVAPLLDGNPYGCVYLIGPPRAPIGYIVIAFGWSVEFGGLDAIIDELYIRPGVRGRGIASEALIALPRALAGGGLRAIHLEVDKTNAQALKLYQRAGFSVRDNYMFMSKRL
ncbi:GNAT family N-acetyltransferase [Sulfitobacter donghicola]|uniref:Acetyltransferase n=1 Tax=Sulfitobacter donghicola DSW-25 = KCTC 12864 = JCM 14565 TaxID=1300350 RepID=A0A073IIJ9_9RHOB|nr:GNAT family N-acetyltransferase [Sulfitobacter donghicola]KEJ89579.1 acetyltransferase [Sulfitobacter donghicola DSW-25 = KCTC 12864 = JCM 14565]KIN69412.1 Acetyltransferase, gnat family [Sulfitobacter donghicola DSW-25 = KCTC 12864 = JCM 14565]